MLLNLTFHLLLVSGGHEVGAVCGKDQWCKPGYTCEFVYPFCPIDVDPCFPVLACVPHGQPNRPIER